MLLKKRLHPLLITLFVITLLAACAAQWQQSRQQRTASLATTLSTTDNDTTVTDPRDTLRLEDMIMYTDNRGQIYLRPSAFKNLAGFTGDSIFINYPNFIDFGEHNEMLFSGIDSLSILEGVRYSYTYDLYHKGIIVQKYAYTIHHTKKKIEQMHLSPPKKLTIDIDTTKIQSKKSLWKSLEKVLSIYEQIPEMPPKVSLKIKQIDSDYLPMYEVKIWIKGKEHFDHRELILDAYTLEILSNNSLISYCNQGISVPGTSICTNSVPVSVNEPIIYYQNQPNLPAINPIQTPSNSYTNPITSGSRPMGMRACNTNTFIYAHDVNSFNIKTFDFSQNPTTFLTYDASLNTSDCVANTAQWGAIECINYFNSTTYGFNMIQDFRVGITPNSQVAGSGSLGTPNSYGIFLGTNTSTRQPFVTLDIIGHEFTHGIDQFTTNISGAYAFTESHILEEGLCDIFGIVLEKQHRLNDWSIGNDANYEVRNLEDPYLSTTPQPKFYYSPGLSFQPQNWLTPSDLAGITDAARIYAHHNNGVINFWFYLLSEGITNYTNEAGEVFTINGININKAAKIVYEAMVNELKTNDPLSNVPLYPNKNFVEFRAATLAVSKLIYGPCSTEQEAIKKAWDAVGVYGPQCDLDGKLKLTKRVNILGCKCRPITVTCRNTAGTIQYFWKDEFGNKIPGTDNKPQLTDLECNKTYFVEVIETQPDGTICTFTEQFECDDTTPTASTSTSTGTGLPCGPSSGTLALTPTVTDACHGSYGTVSINTNSVSPPVNYVWSSGGVTSTVSLAPGTYTVTATDLCQNIGTATVTINEAPQLNLTGNVVNHICNNQPSLVTTHTSGGTPPYNYQWSNGNTSATISNVPAGQYQFTVTDALGCQATQSFTIEDHTITANVTTTESCSAFDDGTAEVTATGGVGPFSYVWSDYPSANPIPNWKLRDNLPSGAMWVDIIDVNGCTYRHNFTVPTASTYYEPTAGTCSDDLKCNGKVVTAGTSQFDQSTETFISSECAVDIFCPLTNTTERIEGALEFDYKSTLNLFGRDCNPFDYTCKQRTRCVITLPYKTIDKKTQSWTAMSNTRREIDVDLNPQGLCPAGEQEWIIFCDGVWTRRVCGLCNCELTPCRRGCADYCNPNICPNSDPCYCPNAPSNCTYALEAPVPSTIDAEVFPNPFRSSFNIEFKTELEDLGIRVFNALGQLVHQEQGLYTEGRQISMYLDQALANGMYYVEIKAKNGASLTKKIIKSE